MANKQTLQKWCTVYNNEEEGSPKEIVAIQKITEFAISFQDWFYVEQHVIPGPFQTTALQGMIDTATTIDHWRLIYRASDYDKDQQIAVANKIASQVTNYYLWNDIRKTENGPLFLRAVLEMANTAVTVEELRFAYYLLDRHSLLDKYSQKAQEITDKIGLLVNDAATWKDILENEPWSGPLHPLALQKINSLK